MVQFPYDGKQFVDLELQNHSKWHLRMLNFWHKSPDVRKWRGQSHNLPLSSAVSLNSSRRGAPNSEKQESNIGARNSCISALALSVVLSKSPWARHWGVNQPECRPGFTQSSLSSSLSSLDLTYAAKSVEVFKNHVLVVPAGTFWRKIPKVWSYKFMMELWAQNSDSSICGTSQSRQGLARVVTFRETQPGPPHSLQGPVGVFLKHECMGRKENQQTLSLAWQAGSWPAENFWLSVNLFLWQACCKENTFPSLSCAHGSYLLHCVTGRELWAQGWQKAQPNLESKHTSQNGGMWIFSLMSFSSSNFKWCSNLNCYK